MTRDLAAVLLGLALLAPAQVHAGAGPAPVRIRGFAYQPETITVQRGAAVEWVNEDEEPHTVTSDDDGFRSSRALDAGKRFALTFERKGRFPYHCALHPHMSGTVVVE